VGRGKRGMSKLYSEELNDLYIKVNICVKEGGVKRGVSKI
jgi:hypothetical protein